MNTYNINSNDNNKKVFINYSYYRQLWDCCCKNLLRWPVKIY